MPGGRVLGGLKHAIGVAVDLFRTARDVTRNFAGVTSNRFDKPSPQDLLQTFATTGAPLARRRSRPAPGARRTPLVKSPVLASSASMGAPRGDIVKYEGDLLISACRYESVQRACVKRALQHLHDRRQFHEPRVGRLHRQRVTRHT